MSSAKLPEMMSLKAEDQRKFKSKVDAMKKKPKPQKKGKVKGGVVYIGHVPHGFFEPQMREYFKQFGRLNRLRIARSKKTGRIKGYAFVEFQSDDVAKVVVESMNNYLMFNKLLKCQYLPTDEVHPETFKNCHRFFSKPKAHIIAAKRHNDTQTLTQERKSIQRGKRNRKRTAEKLGELGVSYDFPKATRSRKFVQQKHEYATLPDEDSDSEAKPILTFPKLEINDDKDVIEIKIESDSGVATDSSYIKTEDEEVKPDPDELERLAAEAIHVLYEDSEDEDEIGFITPPKSVRRRSSVMPASQRSVPLIELSPEEVQPDTDVTETKRSRSSKTDSVAKRPKATKSEAKLKKTQAKNKIQRTHKNNSLPEPSKKVKNNKTKK